jgi:type IV secretion system protein VirB4
MTALARQKTSHGVIAEREVPVSDFIPYTRHINASTISTIDGQYLQIIRLDGFPFETADDDMLLGRKIGRNMMIRSLRSSEFALMHHMIRRSVDWYPTGTFTEPFCDRLNSAYRDKLSGKRLFVNDHYMTVVRRPLRGSVGLITRLGRTLSNRMDDTQRIWQEQAEVRKLEDAVATILETLRPYGAELLSVYQNAAGDYFSPQMEFLGTLINGTLRPYRLPYQAMASALVTHRPVFGRESFERRGGDRRDINYGAMLSLKDYPSTTTAGLLDSLMGVPHELVISQSFGLVDRPSALEKIRRIQGRLEKAEDKAISLVAELADAADDVASGRIVAGEHHLTVMVKASSPQELDGCVRSTLAEFTDIGLVAVREDLNMEAAFWAQLPGNFSFIARKSLVKSDNFAGFASLHNYPHGSAEGNHWGPAVTLLETTSNAPYFYNFHVKDVGNFIVIGPTGSGKTVLLLFLLAQAQRFGVRCVYFDKDRGAELFIRAIHGRYVILKPGEPSGFNPLLLPDSIDNRAFLAGWLKLLLRQSPDDPMTAEELGVINDAVSANYKIDPQHRRLFHLADLFKGHERASRTAFAERLKPWIGSGDRAWLFDNTADTLDMSAVNLGFDLTYILDDPALRTPALSYMFHRVDERLDGQRTVIFIDEGWKALDDPEFAMRIKDWEKTIRKKNGLIGFGTQEAGDAIASRVGQAIIEQSPTQIFMPNNRANIGHYKQFGLTNEEVRIIRELPDTSRCFLVKQGAASVVARLDLSGLDDELAILSSRKETVTLCETIRAEVGDDPADWVPLFLQRKALS